MNAKSFPCLAVVALACVLASCGDDGGSSTDAAPTTVTSTTNLATVTTTATPPVTTAPLIEVPSLSYTSLDGYKQRITISIGSYPSYSKSVNNLPPGKAAVEMLSGSVVVKFTNELMDRTVDLKSTNVAVDYLFPKSAVGSCDAFGREFIWKGETFCEVLGPLFLADPTQSIAPGATVQLRQDQYVLTKKTRAMDEAAAERAVSAMAKRPIVKVATKTPGPLALCEDSSFLFAFDPAVGKAEYGCELAIYR